MSEVDTEIETLCQRRHEIWAGHPSKEGELSALQEKLDALYEQRRHERAQVPRHADVIRRARTETELEKLSKR